MKIANTHQGIKRILLASSIGNLLEMYSFSLFVVFLPILTPIFFPDSDPLAALLFAYGVFSVGFLAYPLGALIFGYIGDKYGRRIALSFSLLGMAISTFCIGLLPSYSVLGIISPLLLTGFRIVQGACAGGECIGSGIFIVEHVSNKSPGFFGSITAASGTFGALCASIVSTILVSSITPSWAWRIAFVLSLLIGGIGLYLRNTVVESPSFRNSLSGINSNPIQELMQKNFKAFLCAIGIGALGTAPFYLVIGFLNSYLVFLENLPVQDSTKLNFLLLSFCAFTLPIAGHIADKIGHIRIMTVSAFLSLIYAYPFFNIAYSKSFFNIACAEILFLSLSQLFVAPINAFLTQLFPIHYRYSGAAFGYCVGMALFGGTAPYISLSLINWSGNISFPFFYVIFVNLIGMASVLISKVYVLPRTMKHKLIGVQT